MYDLIIIGGSAAAMTAGIYASRRGLNFKIITKDFGGEVATSGEIGNWPGDGATNGIALAEKFKKHLESYKIEMEDGIAVEKIIKVEDSEASGGADGYFCITANNENNTKMAAEKLPEDQDPASKCDYTAKAVIIATGVHPRELDVPGEKEFRNKGVSYCTVCDGPLFKGRMTAVIGGGNSALEAGLMLADICSKVYILNKNANFKGEEILLSNLKTKSNVEILYEVKTKEITGTNFVDALRYDDKDGNDHELKVEGVFVHIGMIPNSGIVPDDVKKDNFGQIEVNSMCETSVPGLYAAGDVTDVAFKQIVIAAGQGCIALLSAVNYLNRLKS